MIHYLAEIKENKILGRASDQVLKKILNGSKVKTFLPKTRLFEDVQEQGYYFIVKGIAKGMLREREKSLCMRFFKAGDIVADLSSECVNTRKGMTIECITYVSVIFLSKNIFRELMEECPSLKYLYIENLATEAMQYKDRILGFYCHPAKERYMEFVTQFGGYLTDLSQKDIASYLAIKPETLSRIKKDMHDQEFNYQECAS